MAYGALWHICCRALKITVANFLDHSVYCVDLKSAVQSSCNTNHLLCPLLALFTVPYISIIHKQGSGVSISEKGISTSTDRWTDKQGAVHNVAS